MSLLRMFNFGTIFSWIVQEYLLKDLSKSDEAVERMFTLPERDRNGVYRRLGIADDPVARADMDRAFRGFGQAAAEIVRTARTRTTK